ncbi:TPA: hypothetical protein SL686_005096 [Pseudomonas aeruginosa]|uniref:hypothetical protein n=1 Tax=Pseudomonas aeruginosa TaxID=287 RepID=UPI0003B94A80|nr:hypothetical protein [Pseudomonas aeruginosa]ERV72660.1 hypothetical protein Q058_05147 [Pseudomonas aeruginosa BL04]KSE70860.1 hypothetical protein AO924_32525 [Pseudomonas aeruginosa]MBG5150312.1 hypothetical protein [Pseudomonas aeruginosa]MDC3822272.1 hypothetical protein [Pseudomonas aeruginosa]MDN3869939.1 hypothetical protein [Pseudomonas aeruginosa]
MTWASVTMRWPAQATRWLDDLSNAQKLAGGELASTTKRMHDLQGLATTNPGPVGAAAGPAISAGRNAMASTLGQAPACLAVTPFQTGIGQGKGHQRFLSAPNLLQLLGDKLLQLPQRNDQEQHALVLLFLGTRYDQLAATLGRFNAMMPIPDLQRAERRAGHLARLETEKWILPTAGPLPRWQDLPLERCTITRAARQTLSGQLAVLEGYAADSSPMAELGALAQRKQALQASKDAALQALRAQLENGAEDSTMQARLVGPGNASELRRQLLKGKAPGHEWVLCAGLALVGSLAGLAFVRELVGLDP